MNVTAYHARYYAYDLTRRAATGLDRLSMSLFDAAVDLNPHQIEAALFALESPLSKGVLLADEVGLGKTIEAGIVLCQLWAERKRRLIVICPASIRKQWALELSEKFNLPTRVLDAKTFEDEQRLGHAPLNEKAILIVSFNYANALREDIKAIAWDLVVIDEAHKLRNAYRPSNKVGQGIRWATEDCRKLLLTATPLQNSLIELYGLSTLVDDQLFGDINAFRARYASAGSSLTDLRQRLATFCKRTLRNQVTEYVRYTERRAITRPFTPNDADYSDGSGRSLDESALLETLNIGRGSNAGAFGDWNLNGSLDRGAYNRGLWGHAGGSGRVLKDSDDWSQIVLVTGRSYPKAPGRFFAPVSAEIIKEETPPPDLLNDILRMKEQQQ